MTESPALRRVLIVYSSKPPIIDDLQAAFSRQGIDTAACLADENHWFDRYIIRRINKLAHNLRLLPKSRALFASHRLAHLNYRSDRLERQMAHYAPDLVLLVRGINFRHDTLAKAGTLFGWWIEREERVGEALREAHLFNWYFYISRSCVEQSVAAGFPNCSYQSHLVNPERFRRLPDIGEKRYDVCFVGNWSPRRQRFMEAVLAVTPNVAIYGAKWRQKNLFNPRLLRAVKGADLYGEALNRLYNDSRVVLNINNWGKGEGKARSGMNMRIFEVPASGAFLLTDGSRELEEFLTPGRHLAIYEGEAELAAQLRHFLADPAARQAIADAGHAHVVQHYSYDLLVRQIIDRYTQGEAA